MYFAIPGILFYPLINQYEITIRNSYEIMMLPLLFTTRSHYHSKGVHLFN